MAADSSASVPTPDMPSSDSSQPDSSQPDGFQVGNSQLDNFQPDSPHGASETNPDLSDQANPSLEARTDAGSDPAHDTFLDIQPDPHLQVRLKSEGGRLLLMLPPENQTGNPEAPLSLSWMELWQQLKQRLDGGERFWQPNTTVHLIARDRLLDARQLQAIADALGETQLQLKRIFTSRRQTAVAAATAGYSVEQQSTVTHLNQQPEQTGQALAEPLYIQTTLRSGAEIRHPGSVVILGDLNPGSSVVADGDILVWGRLRGVAHAGAKGNSQCLIMALQMEPTQIRIADFVARAPETPPAQYYPEVAYVAPKGIRIARATDFSRVHQSPLSNPSQSS